MTHSGLQFGGAPINVCLQEQDAVFVPPGDVIERQTEFGPHGDGLHGSVSTGASAGKKQI